MLPFKLKMDPIHWFIYLYSCIGMYRNGENQKFVYLSWDIFTTDLLPNPILQNNFIKKSAKKQHMEKLKVVLSPYWHDVTIVKKSLESKNSAVSDVNSMWNESGALWFSGTHFLSCKSSTTNTWNFVLIVHNCNVLSSRTIHNIYRFIYRLPYAQSQTSKKATKLKSVSQ